MTAYDMSIDYDIAMEIAGHEAIVRQAYKDSVGKWTWSVGLTSATGHVVERYIGKPQSLDHCLRVYVWALDNYADAVRKVFRGVPLTKAQFAAALSFHWNTGAIATASWPKLFAAGKMAAARKAFMSYRKPPEVLNRRKAEAALLFDGKWSNTGKMTEYTRVRANGQIDWKSGKQINVAAELRAALAGEVPASDKVIVEQPVEVPVPVPVEIEKPVVPPVLEQKVEKTTSWWQKIIGVFGTGGIGTAFLAGDWKVVAAVIGGVIVILIVVTLLGRQIAVGYREVRDAVEGQP